MSDEQSVTASERPTNVRLLVVFALCLAAIIAYTQRNTISVMEKPIAVELQLGKKEMSWVMSAFFLTYAMFQLPTGWLVKTIGSRRAMTLFVATFSAAALLFAAAESLLLLIVARLAMGVAQSGIFPCAVVSIARWLPERRRSLASGLLGGSMSAGGALGVVLIGFMLDDVGWRISYVLFCVPGFLFAAWFWFWFRDDPAKHTSVNTAELDVIRSQDVSAETRTEKTERHEEQPTPPTPWRRMFTSVPMMALCGQQVFRAVGYILLATWFGSYLRETHGIDSKQVGILNSLPLLAIVIGSPLGGLFADWVFVRTGSKRLSRQGVAAGSLFLGFLSILLSMQISDPTASVSLISVGMFIAAFSGPCAYTTAIDIGGRHVTMVFSLMNMAGNIGAFVFPLVVPYLLLKDSSATGNGNWDLVIYTFAGCFLAAAICWLLADPTVSVDDVGHG